MNNHKEREFTPEHITELGPLDVFVFGSNMNGRHAGGAARLAVEKFGAIEGQAEGLQGRSYAIPTLDAGMRPLPLEDIEAAVSRLLDFAEEHPELHFYVTKIGCGIAGFSVDEIAPIFLKIDWTYRFNVSVPEEFCVIRGVKGFDEDMKCRDMQYAEGGEYKVDGEIKCCDNGIHFCENPAQVFAYYRPSDNSQYHCVEGFGRKDSHDDDSKIVVSRLKVGLKLDVRGVVEAGVEYVRRKADFFIRRAEKLTEKNSGRDLSVCAGRDSSVNSGGDRSVNSGRNCSVNSGGDRSVNSGRNCSVNSGGDYSVNSGRDHSVNSGRDYSVNSGRDHSVNSGRDYSVNSGRDHSVNSGRDCSVNSGRDHSVNSGGDYSVNSGRDHSVNSGRDHSVNSGGDYSVNSGRDYSVNSGRDHSVNSGRDHSVNSGRDYSVNSGRDHSVNSGRDYSVNSGRDHSVNSGRDCSVNSGRDHSVNSGGDYSVNSGRDHSVNSGRDHSVNSGGDYSVNSGRDYSVNSGRDHSVNSGRDHSVNSGRDYSVNSGRDHSVNSGRDYSVNSGRNCSVNSGGDYSVNSGGNQSVCAGHTNSTINLDGANSFGIAGKGSKICGKKGCAICLVDYDDDGNISAVRSAIVDGVKIREDVYYMLRDGEFVEAE